MIQAPISSDDPPPLKLAACLNHSSPVPLYYQLAQAIRDAVDDGTITEGSVLLPEHAMARDLRVSRQTLRRAFRYLEDTDVMSRDFAHRRTYVVSCTARLPQSSGRVEM